MNIKEIIFPLIIGILFGYALVKGGLTKYANISGAFRFTDMTVMKFMLTAIITAGFGVYGLKALHVMTMLPIPATFLLGNALGGLIFGVGMSLAGFCPGTILAGAGEGKVDYLVAGVLGMFTGSFLYGLTYDPTMKAIKAIGAIKTTIPELLNANPFLVLAVLLVFSLILFYLFQRGLKRKDKLEE
jgi:uncharacterized membrane protein YedE/YeeE